MFFQKFLPSLVIFICYSSVHILNAVHNNDSLFQLSVIHLNDFHARFEETSSDSTRCIKNNCIGGFSRLYTAVNTLLSSRPNAILLNAGDNFQGTLWYNLHRWNVTQYFLNKLPTDAYTLGNHDFDDGVAGVVPFIKSLKAPVVVANIDDSQEPLMQGLYNKSTVIIRDGRRIGIIGVILASTDQISATDNLKFTDEIQAINKEAEILVKQKNCSIVIVISHCGVAEDVRIAKEIGPYVGLIVGGHSHTFLYSGANPPGPEKPKGPYPIVVETRTGGKVLVVQASLNTKYLGNLTVWFDQKGRVKDWEGNPIFLGPDIQKDFFIEQEIQEWKISIDEFGESVLGSTKVLLDRSTRRTGESNIGSFFADAIVNHYVDMALENEWTYASIAFVNSGSIRTSIVPGNITYYDLVASQPFGNTVDCIELTGKDIKDLLEYSITPSAVRQYQFHEFLQVSGIRVVYDTKQPLGSRVVRLKVLCNECQVPVYSDIEYNKTYRVATLAFLIDGGDGYSIIKNNMRNRIIGKPALEVFSAYVQKQSPIVQAHDERIILEDSALVQDSFEYNRSTTIHNSLLYVVLYSTGYIICAHFNII